MSLLETLNQPIFNLYDFVLWMTALQGLIFAMLLQFRREKSASHLLLSLFVASIGLGQLTFFASYNPYLAGVLGHLGQASFAVLALIFYFQGPLLYHYLRTLTFGHYRYRRRDWTPIAIWLVTSTVFLWYWPGLLEGLFWRPFVLIGTIGFTVSTIYGIGCIRVIRRYSQRLEDRFCTIESLDFLWLKVFAWGFLSIWIMEVIAPFSYHVAPWFLQQLISHLPSFMALLMVSFVIIAGLMNGRRLERVSERAAWDESRIEAQPPTGQMLRELDQNMRENALYARPQMNIERLANELDMTPRQLSHVINHYFHKNYFEFINDYRLEQACVRLRSPGWADKSVQQIYESVGFRSKSSFSPCSENMQV